MPAAVFGDIAGGATEHFHQVVAKS
jgi:hypothetical protein